MEQEFGSDWELADRSVRPTQTLCCVASPVANLAEAFAYGVLE